MKTYQVLAHWDPEARVWWAESEDVPGLVAEAADYEDLLDDIKALVPELLAENLGLKGQWHIPVQVIADRTEEVCGV